MKRIPLAILAMTALMACDQGSQPSSPSSAAAASTSDSLAGGTKHDPPIKPEQVADNAWYCDMGTVHYSRTDKGDGKCPLCKMDLKQKTAGAPAGSAGHDHSMH